MLHTGLAIPILTVSVVPFLDAYKLLKRYKIDITLLLIKFGH